MIDPVRERAAPISPQLAIRVAGLGVLALALFAVVFFRLWYLQVLSGDQYVAQATQNRKRTVAKPAPRGNIVDRDHETVVENRQAIVLTLSPRSLPPAERTAAAVWAQKVTARDKRHTGHKGDPIPYPPVPASLQQRFRRIGRVAGLSVASIQERTVIGLTQLPYAPVNLRTDVKADVRGYVTERPELFPGVSVASRFVREYPAGSLAAQLLGTVNEIGPKQIGLPRYKGVHRGGLVGQDGLEKTYDRFLRGQDGTERFNVNAQGLAVGSPVETSSRPGSQLKLTLDLKLQRAAQKAIDTAGGGKPGAFVAMNPETGAVYAMGSNPSFDPSFFTRPFTPESYKRLFLSDASDSPLIDRATDSEYPVGSTFKPITALAALATHTISPSDLYDDQGCGDFGTGPGAHRCNARHTAYGPVDLRKAIRVSSDQYFYELGLRLYNEHGLALQTWARKLGLGRPAGLDLPVNTDGIVPDPEYRDKLNREEATCRRGTTYPSGNPKPKGAPCFIADGTDRPYSVGDNVSLAIGQGDFEATPLQMARMYAVLENGGKLVRPHLGSAIEDDQGRLVQTLTRPPAHAVKLPAAGLQAIRDGLHEATTLPMGTSTEVFKGWNQSRFPVYGKTGTASFSNKPDQSWYLCYVPRTPTNPRPIVVAVTIEGGGFGAAAAAPAARQILSQWYYKKRGVFQVGSSGDL